MEKVSGEGESEEIWGQQSKVGSRKVWARSRANRERDSSASSPQVKCKRRFPLDSYLGNLI